MSADSPAVTDTDPDVDHESLDGVLPPWSRPSWPKVVVLVAAFAFLGGAIGYFVGHGRAPGGDSVDVGFYQDMITHHEQAQEMAAVELENGTDQTVRSFAREILIQQSFEIGVMNAKLDEWGYSRGDRPDTAMAWMGSPVPVDSMPGLATPAQIAQLRAAKGRDADGLFLSLMAAHHLGGIHMAGFAATHADDDGVRILAKRMQYNQASEINEFSTAADRLGLPKIATVPVPPTPS